MTLDELLAAAAQRWPAAPLDREQIGAWLDDREVDHASAHALDVVWAGLLDRGEPSALDAFDRDVVADIRGALARFGRGDDFTDEIVQRVRYKLLVGQHGPPRIREYRARGALAAWVQTIALREGLMMLRAERSTSRPDDRLFDIVDTDPTVAHVKRAYKDLVKVAFGSALADLPPRDRTLLRLCFVDGLGCEAIGRLYDVHRATAFRWLRDARETLLVRVRAAFVALTGVRSDEVDTLVRAVASSLEISW
jgi:RNA polymerase sigma-70 factor (ECF subfamily)